MPANSLRSSTLRSPRQRGITSIEFEAMLAGQTARGRVGEPDDVGAAITGLLSDESRWINAQSIEVAGGYLY